MAHAQSNHALQELFAAIKAGDAATARTILSGDPSLGDARDEKGVSALLAALYHRQTEIAGLIRSRRETLDIFEAASVSDQKKLEQILQQAPERVHAYSADGWTALHLAAFFGEADSVRALLSAGAAVDARSNNPMQNTALHAAQVFNQVEASRLLLDAGADVNAKQHGGFTALHAAAGNGCEAMVDLMLSRGANKTLRDDSGKSAADLAAKHPQLAERLR